MRNQRGQSTWSRTIQLSTRQEALNFVSVINPFSNELQVDVATAQSGKAEADLIDASGKIVRHKTTDLLTGVTRIKFENTSGLAPGMYFLRIRNQNGYIQKTVLKTNQ